MYTDFRWCICRLQHYIQVDSPVRSQNWSVSNHEDQIPPIIVFLVMVFSLFRATRTKSFHAVIALIHRATIRYHWGDVECLRQLFEVSEQGAINTSMLFIHAFHPPSLLKKCNHSGLSRYKTCRERPLRYYLPLRLCLSPCPQRARYGRWQIPDFKTPISPATYSRPTIFPMPTSLSPPDDDQKGFRRCRFSSLSDLSIGRAKAGFEFMNPLIADMVQDDPSK